MSSPPPKPLPGHGLFGWLGRQFGHVRRAVKADPSVKIVHRNERVEEAPLADNPHVTLRRTVIDEVVVNKNGRKIDE